MDRGLKFSYLYSICTVFVQLLLKLWIRSLTVVEVDVYRTIVRAQSYRILFINFCNYFPASFYLCTLIYYSIDALIRKVQKCFIHICRQFIVPYGGDIITKKYFPFSSKAKIETIQEISSNIGNKKRTVISLNEKKKKQSNNSSAKLPIKCYLITKNLTHVAIEFVFEKKRDKKDK